MLTISPSIPAQYSGVVDKYIFTNIDDQDWNLFRSAIGALWGTIFAGSNSDINETQQAQFDQAFVLKLNNFRLS